MSDNRRFAELIIGKFDSTYRHRWEIYDGILARLTGQGARWLDSGCGKNEAIGEFSCDFRAGIDLYRHPELIHNPENPFVIGTLENLPFEDSSFTLVSMNTVAEHIEAPEKVFAEIGRVLVPGGKVLIHTTNKYSPPVLLGKLFPERLRMFLFKKIFGAAEEDVFKTFHRLNSQRAFEKLSGFAIEEIHYIQDLNWTSRPVFLLLFIYNLFTKIPGLKKLRTNMVILLKVT